MIPVSAILSHLELERETPSIAYLDRIMQRWTSHIPWETVSRVERHQHNGSPKAYAWFPETFFGQALLNHTGGTCFESNYALWALLKELDFKATLHFCDMPNEVPNPHCAVVVALDGKMLMVDAGFSIPHVIPLYDDEVSTVEMPVYTFVVTPFESNKWEVRRQNAVMDRIGFWLKGTPVDENSFRLRVIRDHEPDGLFLDQLIIQKFIKGEVWRFSQEKGLVRRTATDEVVVNPMPTPQELAEVFGMSEAIIADAFATQAL